MRSWKNFEEKNPKLAKWVREGGLFVPDWVYNPEGEAKK